MQSIIATLQIPPSFADGDKRALVSYHHPETGEITYVEIHKVSLQGSQIETWLGRMLNQTHPEQCHAQHGWEVLLSYSVPSEAPPSGKTIVLRYDFDTRYEATKAGHELVMEEYRDIIGADPGQSALTLASTIVGIFGGTQIVSDLVTPIVLQSARWLVENELEGK